MSHFLTLAILLVQPPKIDRSFPPDPVGRPAGAKTPVGKAFEKKQPASTDAGKTGGSTTAARTAAKTAAPAAGPFPLPVGEGNTEPDEDEGGKTFGEWLKGLFGAGAIGLLLEGGIFMWPILIMLVIACGVIIERYRSLKMLTSDSAAVRRQIQELLQAGRIEEALDVCEREQGPVPAILGAGVRKYLVLKRLGRDPAKIEEQVVKAMDDYSVHVVAALEKHLPILATISSAAPMLGFLGTVAGMVVSFDTIQAELGSGKNIVELAAGGISVALLTTAFGLIVGIPAFIGYNYFSGVINGFVLEVEESATELIESVTLQTTLATINETPAESATGAGSEVQQTSRG